MNGRLDLDPVLCTTPKLAGSQTLEWLDNLCAELYPEDQGQSFAGMCTGHTALPVMRAGFGNPLKI